MSCNRIEGWLRRIESLRAVAWIRLRRGPLTSHDNAGRVANRDRAAFEPRTSLDRALHWWPLVDRI